MRLDHARDPRRQPEADRKRHDAGPRRPPLSRRARWILALGGLAMAAGALYASGAFNNPTGSIRNSTADSWSPIDADITSHETYLNRVDSRIIGEHYISHDDCNLIASEQNFDTAPTRTAFANVSSAFSANTAKLLDRYLAIVTENDTDVLKACSTISSEAVDAAAQAVDGQSDEDALAAAEAADQNAHKTTTQPSAATGGAHFSSDAGTGGGEIPDDAITIARTSDIQRLFAERQRILPLLRQSVRIDTARKNP